MTKVSINSLKKELNKIKELKAELDKGTDLDATIKDLEEKIKTQEELETREIFEKYDIFGVVAGFLTSDDKLMIVLKEYMGDGYDVLQVVRATVHVPWKVHMEVIDQDGVKRTVNRHFH